MRSYVRSPYSLHKVAVIVDKHFKHAYYIKLQNGAYKKFYGREYIYHIYISNSLLIIRIFCTEHSSFFACIFKILTHRTISHGWTEILYIVI